METKKPKLPLVHPSAARPSFYPKKTRRFPSLPHERVGVVGRILFLRTKTRESIPPEKNIVKKSLKNFVTPQLWGAVKKSLRSDSPCVKHES
jgi:hypothetical protein